MKTLITLLLLFVSLGGFSQTKPTDTIDVNKPDIEFLELLTLKKINEFRKENNLDTSIVSNKLKRNTREHSKNMLTNMSLRHSFYGKYNISTENCLITGLLTKGGKTCTYDECAIDIVSIWKRSTKGHREALLFDVKYAYVGVAIKFPYLYATYQSYTLD